MTKNALISTINNASQQHGKKQVGEMICKELTMCNFYPDNNRCSKFGFVKDVIESNYKDHANEDKNFEEWQTSRNIERAVVIGLSLLQ